MQERSKKELRILEHPILGKAFEGAHIVTVTVNGKAVRAVEGEPVALSLIHI